MSAQGFQHLPGSGRSCSLPNNLTLPNADDDIIGTQQDRRPQRADADSRHPRQVRRLPNSLQLRRRAPGWGTPSQVISALISDCISTS